MAKRPVQLTTNQGVFRGLAKQNMEFHQCVAELVDNSIAARKPDKKFRVQVILRRNPDDADRVQLFIVDDARGMKLEVFEKAIQLGESATTEDRLNEHGFGMKNALATLTGGTGWWKVWTRAVGTDDVLSCEGPFQQEMEIETEDEFPEADFLPTDVSTLVQADVKLSFVQTVQGRGAPAKDLNALRRWLIEHLGVLYRGYLEQAAPDYENEGVIIVSIDNDHVHVPAIQVPLGNSHTEYIDVELGGTVHKLEYVYGTLDEVKRDRAVRGEPAKYYYQKNQPTQGIDIRLGKRTIATRQFETIWKTEDGKNQLQRHNHFNEFIGELKIPALPRGVLTTTNNKTDFNLDDDDWPRIFDLLNGFRPMKDIRSKTEAGLRKRWMEILNAANPEDQVSDERHVWPTGTRIDVYRETPDEKVILYELKAGNGAPINLYQLKMYWDGLVVEGVQPREAILICEDFSTTLEEMANKMNDLPPPGKSKPYAFKIERHKDKGLD